MRNRKKSIEIESVCENKEKQWHEANKLPDNRVSFLLSFTQSFLNRLTAFNVCVCTQSNRRYQLATPWAIHCSIVICVQKHRTKPKKRQ